MPRTFWVETLGCPKNQVDSDKLSGKLYADGLRPAGGADTADLVVVNTCAFVEEARQESIDAILALDGTRKRGASLVVTGCLAERYRSELVEALPEVDLVAPFGMPLDPHALPAGPPSVGAGEVSVRLGRGAGPGPGAEPDRAAGLPAFDLLNLPRPRSQAPWAYVKVAEGCDRACGFCAIPSFRGPQRSRAIADVVAEVEALEVREVVLVAQDLAAFGRDQGKGERAIVPLVEAVQARVEWVRLLYLYPSDLTHALIDVLCAGNVPYVDLSLQHVSRPLLRRMRRWGDGDRFLSRIADIRARRPDAAFRSNFIVGYPGETEDDHLRLVRFIEDAQLDWCGFFAFSPEDGTYAAGLDGAVPSGLVVDRLAELTELQDGITAARRDALVGTRAIVLVDRPGVARSFREAPEIDGIVEVPDHLEPGRFVDVDIVGAAGPDLVAEPVGP